MRQLALAMIRFYQGAISAGKPATCRFQPSCSHYTYQAIERFGVLHGTWLGVRRLARCGPWSAGGYDPVPERPGPGMKATRPS